MACMCGVEIVLTAADISIVSDETGLKMFAHAGTRMMIRHSNAHVRQMCNKADGM